MRKLRYELNQHNRKIIQKAGKKLSLTRFCRVLDRRFKTGPNNSLIYHIKPIQGVTPEAKGLHTK